MKNIEYYKNKLIKERSTLVGELNKVGIAGKGRNSKEWQTSVEDDDPLRADPNEVGDKLEHYEENDALVRELETRLIEIDAALERIEKKTYGVCEIDGEDIETERLEADPAARTCKKHIKN